ncbi:MAG: Gfo/Idh/MocA family oxidoreductase [Halobacteriovoraceae bacterium]|jgi:predicted dehydrogenase|nr:Gfo/Idh/MocA family oxidoreductase [Halobacteriovoraceae bacterium]
MEKVNVAVIGYGHLGKWHTQKAAAFDNTNLVAIVEPFEQNQKIAQADYPDVKVVSDIADVLDSIDAAIIVTPTSTHFELTKNLLQNKKHVFCEKPLCSTYGEAKDLEPFLGAQVLQVGHSERCHQAWEGLKDTFQTITGKKTIKITRYAPFKGRATDVDVVQDLMIHDIDLMLYLFGKKPSSVSSLGHKIRTDKWDHVTSHFFFDDGDEVIITSGRNHVKEVRALEVMSEVGCHYVDLFANTVSYATNEQFDDGSYVQTQNYEKRDHLLLEQKSFFNAIQTSSKPMVDYTDGLNAVYFVSKVNESLEEGKRLTL